MIESQTNGCFLEARFDWSISSSAARWSTPQQAYKYNTIPYLNAGGETNYPYSVIDTRLKVKGKGRVVILRYSNDGDKDFELLGYSAPFSKEEEGSGG